MKKLNATTRDIVGALEANIQYTLRRIIPIFLEVARVVARPHDQSNAWQWEERSKDLHDTWPQFLTMMRKYVLCSRRLHTRRLKRKNTYLLAEPGGMPSAFLGVMPGGFPAVNNLVNLAKTLTLSLMNTDT